MIFKPSPLPDVWLVAPEKFADDRGFFARTYGAEDFTARGIDFAAPVCNVSFNRHRGTLRGMHYQIEPKPETKLVRCTAGRMFDVALDLRPKSPAYRQWFGVELDAARHEALFIPPGCAHGFLTLSDDCEVLYLMSATYDPVLARGVRWNDPAFAIAWPAPPLLINERDAGWPDFAP